MADEWYTAIKAPYDKPRQAFSAEEYVGLAMAVESLKEQPELIRNMPGFRIALSIVEARAANERTNQAIATLRFITKKGIDINTHMVASYQDYAFTLALVLFDHHRCIRR